MLAKIIAAISVTTCFIASAIAASAVDQLAVPILIERRCQWMFFGPPFADEHGKMPKLPKFVPWDPARAKPMVYTDPRTSITFYVESDGRHLAAIDTNGKLLWVRNPFEDRHMCPYRTPRPVIGAMKATEISPELAKLRERWGVNTVDKYIAISFDSSQFGVVNEATGDFDFETQN